MENRWLPTRKWVVARVTALTGLAVLYATTGGWDLEETLLLITILGEGATSYLTPNKPPLGSNG